MSIRYTFGICAMLLVGFSSCIRPPTGGSAREWRPFYEDGRWERDTTAWIGGGTESRHTADGLLVADTSTQKDSGHMYMLNWHADPAKGAAIEACVRVVSCSAPYGVSMMAADGIHEESLTIYPNRLQLENAKLSVDFDAAGGFHTYRLVIKGVDVRLFVDGKLMVDASGKFTSPALSTPPRNQCGFGCGSSAATGEAIWQWVKFQSDLPARVMPARPEIPGLAVNIGETIELIPGATYVSMFKFRDGRLVVGGKHSSDGGKTWTNGPGLGVGAFEFTDGEIISPGFNTHLVSNGVFEVPLARSTNGGRTFQNEQARLNIPEATGGTGDDGKRYEGPPVDHAVIQLRDGSLLMAMYGYFKTDTVLCPAFPPEWKLYKYRNWVMRSTDRGRTWNYLATVAYDPEVGAESFCEADLLTLPGGDILCFMRTGGNPPKYTTPLYMNVSKDDGKTWSKPVPIADRGVWPNACRMESGVLALTYGRPDNWLAFSLDDGKTWAGHLCFYEGPTSSYNTIEEIAPGKLFVVYDRRSLNADGKLSSGIVGTYVTVQRQK
ncbi:MAG: sialidase family protein [Kiritimatiellaeota bacterium]|nr:sialidase family protein [Kiritimatiellota bacterium]